MRKATNAQIGARTWLALSTIITVAACTPADVWELCADAPVPKASVYGGFSFKLAGLTSWGAW